MITDITCKWGKRISLAVVDQGLTSVANFVVNLILIRTVSTEAYGAFAVTITSFLVVSGIYNSLLLEPTSILGVDEIEKSLPTYLAQLMCLHILLTCVMSIGVGLAAHELVSPPLSRALGCLAITLPFMLLPWLLRRICYLLDAPEVAASGGMVYFLVILILSSLTWKLDLLSPESAIVSLAIASAGSSLAMYSGLPTKAASRYLCPGGIRDRLRTHWNYGKWVALQTAFSIAASYAPLFFVATLLGLSSAGSFRALSLTIQPAQQALVAVAGILFVPLISRAYSNGDSREVKEITARLGLGFTVGSLIYLILLVLFRVEIAAWFGLSDSGLSAWLVPAFGFVLIFLSIAAAPDASIRASRRLLYYPLSTGVPGMVSICLTPLLIYCWEMNGAVFGAIVSASVYSGLCIWLYRRWVFPGVRGMRLRDYSFFKGMLRS